MVVYVGGAADEQQLHLSAFSVLSDGNIEGTDAVCLE
jgi:hypothetical protein